MTIMKTRVALVALVMIAAGAVSACGSNPVKDAVDGAVGNAVENGVEQAVGAAAGDGTDIDLDFDGGGASLPDNFPDDIPRPDGKLTAAVSSADGWTLAFAPTDASNVEALVGEFGSGWTLQSETDYGEWKTWAFQNDDHLAMINAIDDGEGWTISMTVVPVTE